MNESVIEAAVLLYDRLVREFRYAPGDALNAVVNVSPGVSYTSLRAALSEANPATPTTERKA